jgi:hypothetical protein
MRSMGVTAAGSRTNPRHGHMSYDRPLRDDSPTWAHAAGSRTIETIETMEFRVSKTLNSMISMSAGPGWTGRNPHRRHKPSVRSSRHDLRIPTLSRSTGRKSTRRRAAREASVCIRGDDPAGGSLDGSNREWPTRSVRREIHREGRRARRSTEPLIIRSPYAGCGP